MRIIWPLSLPWHGLGAESPCIKKQKSKKILTKNCAEPLLIIAPAISSQPFTQALVYKRSKHCQKSGKDLATQSGVSISTPGTSNPATAKAMAMR